jgi:hypothetical protein
MVFKEDYPKFEETAPDDFDPAKPYADPVAFIEQREHLVREKFVEIETLSVSAFLSLSLRFAQRSIESFAASVALR